MTSGSQSPHREAPAPIPASAPARTFRRRRAVIGTGLLFGAAGTAFAVVLASTATGTSAGTSTPQAQAVDHGWSGGWAPGGYGSGALGGGTSDPALGSTSTVSGLASSAQDVGVVDITTVLKYENAAAAGTGMILTANGEVLTNNHVVDGATAITVTVVSTGATYTATVVGTDPTADVAVLQLASATGLPTATFSSATPTIGEAVTAVGNAGGTGGTPSAASGVVTALNQSITASDGSGSNSEQLAGLIETDAAVQAGDSGGPLYDASGAIIGMDTAASSGGVAQAYAIPTPTAEAIAAQIENGVSSATIHQGYPAFLGIEVQSSSAAGALVAGVLAGGPAADAGITAGDLITAVGGTAITSAGDLSAALSAHAPGQTATVTWTDATGASHSASATLATGPAD